MNTFLKHIGIELPIIQAPMAGVSTPEMAAAVSEAGGLGSIGVGNVDAETARTMISELRSMTDRPFNVNVFCHHPAVPDAKKEAEWLRFLAPQFARFGAAVPGSLHEIYTSFVTDDDMLAMLLEERPPIVSFHFGLPSAERITVLRSAGIILLATATNLAEGRLIQHVGIDAIVAQGYEAGGHRGVFDPSASDDCLPTLLLARKLAAKLSIPVIAAGGIMDGSGIAMAMAEGASAAQLGTAYILCPESSADSGYRKAIVTHPAPITVMTSAISGRPARSLANRFTALGETIDRRTIPDYPIAYDAGKQLHAAAKKHGEYGFGAQWAGQSVSHARAMPAGELTTCIGEEFREAFAVTSSSSVAYSFEI